ncbi:HNH endonuclease signature motif containing protein [Camelimonas fluminis]|uniref:HNH endonuclease signature motif containing protein n=1 Tax=Camelimonas fluminis TaxID=1576911 RepID=A0ABV7UI22_9HYPH|nr:HNH endonuclease signature motif containing protein [Camelimonas fluminis]
MSHERVCERCGAGFQRLRKYSSAQWAKAKYCSKKCAGIRRSMSGCDIRQMYEDEKSSSEIAAVAGISPTQVLRVLHGEGVRARSASENKKISHARPETKQRLSAAFTGRALPESAKAILRGRTGPINANWRSGLTISAGGYVCFTSSPANGEHAGKPLHKIVAEWKIGRRLLPDEVVHHADRNKLNNDPNNLEVMTSSEHARLHIAAGEFGRKRGAA